MELYPHQKRAVEQLRNGSILWGGVGTGKTATALGYYVEHESPRDLVVITTAKKRNELDWQGEAAKFGIGEEWEGTTHGMLTVDSWNNITKYKDVDNAFFIFDEQRVVGTGAWVKAFIKIARNNRWILLSATPGDTWLDYAPVFVANGYYKNITEFKRIHVKYAPYVKFPKVDCYVNTGKLVALRNQVLVEMPYQTHTERVINWLDVSWDKEQTMKIMKERWNVYDDVPVQDVGEMYRLMRKVANTDPSRLEMVHNLLRCHDRLIIFYTFNYELEILRTLADRTDVFEYNGHVKDPVPTGEKWVYLVQYAAGAEGWNCTSTDAMCMYSMTYSYKAHMQALGRIDRLDTEYNTLYYYILVSGAPIDRGIKAALRAKKDFNERKSGLVK